MTVTLPMPITAPLTKAQRAQLFNMVRRAAKAEIMPRFRTLSAYEIDTKTGAQDLVTEADRAAEAMLTRGLQAMFPHAVIVGEEAASARPEIMDKLAEAELCITIDPVDGTWNYAKGLPLFGVMVAILRFGVPVFGLLYDPVLDDVIWADTETKTQLQRPRRADRAMETGTGSAPVAALSGFVPLYLIPEDKREQAAIAMTRFDRVWSLRCACHEFRTLSQGEIDFVLFAKLTPWDQPAGVIATQQAGGHVAMLDGSEYGGALTGGYLLAARNEATWKTVAQVFDFLLDQQSAVPENPEQTDTNTA